MSIYNSTANLHNTHICIKNKSFGTVYVHIIDVYSSTEYCQQNTENTQQ